MKIIKADKTFTHGIGEGKAFVLQKSEKKVASYTVSEGQTEAEISRFKDSAEKVQADLAELAETSPIFAGHLSIAGDFALHETVIDKIKSEHKNAEMALDETIMEFKAMMEAMDDPYLRERGADFADVGERFLKVLRNEESSGLSDFTEPVVIVAKDLTPSDTSVMDFDYVKGFITEEGGVTSHVCIIARSAGIPALVGVKDITREVSSGDELLFDASSGEIFINPDEESKKTLRERAKREQEANEAVRARSKMPAVTKDGHEVKVYANVGSVKDVEAALEHNIDGVGLFRSEFLFMDNTHFPTEEEQFEAYREAVTLLGKEMIIRTLDIGGDKELCYYSFDREENPFLGWRAVRMCLCETEIFKTQLKALLRASHFGPIKIMIPMVISLEEVQAVQALIEECKAELDSAGQPYNKEVPVGIMAETPAAVLTADILAEHVDFFSIGTNDLTQYVLAVDRGNKKIENLYNSFHPAVLRAIYQIIQAGLKAGIEVGMCGEFASNPHAAELLLGMGLEEFSMAASETAAVKDIIRNLSYAEAKKKAEAVLACATAAEVYEVLGIEG